MLKKVLFYTVALGVMSTSYSMAQVSDASLFFDAAINGDARQIQTLMQRGFYLDAEDASGDTALCMAKKSGNRRAYNLLLNAGASTSARCMKGTAARDARSSVRPAPRTAAKSSDGIRLNGGLAESPYSETVAQSSKAGGAFWTASSTAGAIGLLIGGGVVAALIAGGGSGGSGSGSSSGSTSDRDILAGTVPSCLGGTWENRNGTYVCKCPEGKLPKNGACIVTAEQYQTNDVVNSGTVEITSEEDILVAELGANLTNNGTITGTTNNALFNLVGLRVNGFSDKAYSGELTPETTLISTEGSLATNNGEISLNQGNSGGELYGIQALAGALAHNGTNGSILLNVNNAHHAYGIYAEDPSEGVVNNGSISINAYYKADEAYAMYALDRGIVNTGDINFLIENPNFDKNLSGTLAGLYGNNVRNRGTITLRRGEDSDPNNLNFYGMYAVNTGMAENQKKGVISMDVTGTPFYSYGMYANKGTDHFINDGTIEIYGELEHLLAEGIGGTYAMRFTGGHGMMTNNGVITTSRINPETEEKEYLSMRGDGFLAMMRGFSGSITNNALIDIHVINDAPYDVWVEDESLVFMGARWTIEGIDLEKDESEEYTTDDSDSEDDSDTEEKKGILNNSEVNIVVESGESSGVLPGSKVFAVYGGNNTTAENAGRITVLSSIDWLDLYGMISGTVGNKEYGRIYIEGSGLNTAIYGEIAWNRDTDGADSGEEEDEHHESDEDDIDKTGYRGKGNNAGDITVIHHGCGLVQGLGGGNYGNVTVIGDPYITDTVRPLDVAGVGSDVNEGNIYITLSGSTKGETRGLFMDGGTSNSGLISITFKDRTMADYGDVYGIISDGIGGTVENSGKIVIDAYESIGKGTIHGIHAGAGTNIINKEGAKVEIRANGDVSIQGMQNNSYIAFDGYNYAPPALYKILNQGTLSITAVNTVAHEGMKLQNLHGGTTTVPFEIAGIVTNSYAVNSGDILLDVSGNARVAGMIAYDGGMVVNTGMIEFRGKAENFTALYGVGGRSWVKETKSDPSKEDVGELLRYETVRHESCGDDCSYDVTTTVEKQNFKETVTKTKNVLTQFSTVYNYGRIKLNEVMLMGNDEEVATIEGGAVVANVGSQRSAANQLVTSVVGDTVREGTTTKTTVLSGAEDAEQPNPKVTTETTYNGDPVTEPADIDVDYSNYVFPSRASEAPTDEYGIVVFPESLDDADDDVGDDDDVGGDDDDNNNSTGSAPVIVTLNDGVNYSSEKGGSFEAEGHQVAGSVIGGVSNVLGGNKTSYVATGFGEGAIVGNGDDSLLDITSDSYLFNASFEKNETNSNGLNIVMNMKSFDEVVDDKVLSNFLQANYLSGNNEAFFDVLKSSKTGSAFNSTLNKLIGKDVISKFNWEDLSAMRDLNFAMNEDMFSKNDNDQVFGKAGTVNSFSFKTNDSSSTQYGLVNKYVTPRFHVGYGASFTNLKTNDSRDNKRQDTMVQFFAPIGYEMNGVKMISNPRLGYAKGHYTRQGLDGSYKGSLEKRVFGLMNEARYPIDLGSVLLEPAVEFNALGYTQSGHEDRKAYSLNIQRETTLSVEGGIGLYAKKTIGNWNLRTGFVYYHEFANPYEVRVGMNGMNGSFVLTDDGVGRNRELAIFDLTYDMDGVSVYGNLRHYMQNDSQTAVKAGLKLDF